MIALQVYIGIILLTYSSARPGAGPDIAEMNALVTHEKLVHMDLLLPPGKHESDYFVGGEGSSPDGTFKTATTVENRLWSLPIPYIMDSSIDDSTKNVILEAFADFGDKTCITFAPRTTQTDYIKFAGNLKGCYAHLGRIGNEQIVSLGSGCALKRIAVHEIMHALGFLHEQSRADRDNHVKIYWENILPGAESQFQFANPRYFPHSLFVSYDYKSVMHYKRQSYTRNNKDTITPIGITYTDDFDFGQPDNGGLSVKDAVQVNRLYKCNGIGQWNTWGRWGYCTEDCGGGRRYRYRSCYKSPCSGRDQQTEECNTHKCRGGGGGCFPSDAFVRNNKGKKVAMKDLKVGEKVLTMDNNGRPVYSTINMMMHSDPIRTGKDFVAMAMEDGSHITLTSYHLIPLETSTFIYAKDIKPGQNVTVFNAFQNRFVSKEVISVELVNKTGYYAPLSMEGTVVVNDVYVSCYATFPSHWISHFVFSFWRILYTKFESLLSHRVDADGIHWYPRILMTTATSLNIL